MASIAPGDIVQADKKGRTVYGRVVEVADDGTVAFEPLAPGTSYRHARPREIVGHWRRTGRARAEAAPRDAGPQLSLAAGPPGG